MQRNLMNEVPMPIKSMETHDHVYLIVGSVTPFLTVPMRPKPTVRDKTVQMFCDVGVFLE